MRARKRARKELKCRTAWHPLFCQALSAVAPDEHYKVLSEVQLSREPQRADCVIIKRHAIPCRVVELLRSIFDHLGEHTLIELKGPTDEAEGDDLHDLMSHAWQYSKLEGITNPSRLHLMVVANTLTGAFRNRCEAYGRRFEEVEPGIWLSKGGEHVIYFVETMAVDDPVLFFFSRGFVNRPRDIEANTAEEIALFQYLFQQVEQLKGSIDAMALRDWDKLEKGREEALMKMVELLPPEKVLSMFASEERLRGLPPDDREEALMKMVELLPPEKVLSRFPPEERLKGLPPDERLRGLPPEERLKGLQLEDVLKALPPEQLERFKKLMH